MKDQKQLTSRTFSAACKMEVLTALPGAAAYKKKYVPGVGVVYFILDRDRKRIGQCFSDLGNMVLNIL